MFGIRIKELRLSHGMNQVEFAKTLSVSKQSVSNWENENIQPSIDMLSKIATMYSVSTDYLLGLDNRKTLDVTDLDSHTVALLQSIINKIKS